MIYVADTHSLIWFLASDANLPQKARTVFERVEGGEDSIVIPTIVLAELMHISEKKGMEDLFFRLLEMLKDGLNYSVYNLDLDVMVTCKGLRKLREMHDRIIVATARILDAVVITRDEEIRNSGYVQTVW